MTDTTAQRPASDSRSDNAPAQLSPDLLLGVVPILLFNRRGDRLHCFSSQAQAVAFLRAAMRR